MRELSRLPNFPRQQVADLILQTKISKFRKFDGKFDGKFGEKFDVQNQVCYLTKPHVVKKNFHVAENFPRGLKILGYFVLPIFKITKILSLQESNKLL